MFVVHVRLTQGDEIKPVSTSFIGVSPEFEVALYTLIFFEGAFFDHHRVNWTVIPWSCHGDNSLKSHRYRQ